MNHEKNPFYFYPFKISVKSILNNSRDFKTIVKETAENTKAEFVYIYQNRQTCKIIYSYFSFFLSVRRFGINIKKITLNTVTNKT